MVAEAGTNAVATFTIAADGTLRLRPAATGQAATCWIVLPAASFTPPTRAADVTGFRGEHGGPLTPLGNTPTGAGTVDAAASSDGRFLYVQTGATGGRRVLVGADGSLEDRHRPRSGRGRRRGDRRACTA